MATFPSFAKLNLHLQVVGRRADGYHELRTLFQTVDLADQLEIERTGRPGVDLAIAAGEAPTGDDNLARRAARAFLEQWGSRTDGVRVALHKRIPPGGGLGGGSANAATVLRAMATIWGVRPTHRELWELARGLGADVPFFLSGGYAAAFGRGDEIVPLPDAEPDWTAWLAIPSFGVATPDAFAALGGIPGTTPDEHFLRALRRGPEEVPWRRIGRNDLEAPVFRLRPELEGIYTSLVRARARVVRMSGSGSTIFALFDDDDTARRAGSLLPPGTAWLRVRSLGGAAWRRASGFAPIEGEE